MDPMMWMAGASLLGNIYANRSNKRMSRENMAFQERMSSTAHQREMNDLSLSGLNPVLSAKYGGASSPGGSTAEVKNPFGDIPSHVASALALKRTKLELANLSAQNAQIMSQVELNAANARAVEAARAKDMALQPFWQLGGSTARSITDSVSGVNSGGSKPGFWERLRREAVRVRGY